MMVSQGGYVERGGLFLAAAGDVYGEGALMREIAG